MIAHLLALVEGDLEEVVRWGGSFVRPHLTAAVPLAYGTYALAEADLGRGRVALDIVRQGRSVEVGDASGASFLSWAEAEARWLMGQPDRALDAAAASLEQGVSGFPVRPLAGVIRAWAELELGLKPRPAPVEGWVFADAAEAECRGIGLLAAGEYTRALDCFTEAATLAADAPRFAFARGGRWGRRCAGPVTPVPPASTSAGSSTRPKAGRSPRSRDGSASRCVRPATRCPTTAGVIERSRRDSSR